ncbi:unnamed protein product [Rangifer tarandus platyrhynchus]|uniref:Uncharacterized protein n=2 Tax=Rangifer tarandus platyrhynchus TaxID=3082113 RepID=A0ACB0DWW8_RANTA|nr:unnamed protein product [Rangifer tarandus platyrhynchus]CAI9692658.1 unnamed protein product [Rangifer tarandus platyrhynchus]
MGLSSCESGEPLEVREQRRVGFQSSPRALPPQPASRDGSLHPRTAQRFPGGPAEHRNQRRRLQRCARSRQPR